MVFFMEEIRAFNIAYFENTCTALDSEKGMEYYAATYLDKEALDIITRSYV